MKFRYRTKTRLFSAPLVILQVEHIEEYSANEGHVSGSTKTWRDATPDDLFPSDLGELS